MTKYAVVKVCARLAAIVWVVIVLSKYDPRSWFDVLLMTAACVVVLGMSWQIWKQISSGD
jgi:hypothetical protein